MSISAISPAYTDFTRSAFAPGLGAPAERPDGADTSPNAARTGDRPAPGELTDAERREVQELKRRDAEVRQHEMAHVAAAAGYARGGANFEYQTGPDGVRYAVGGEVAIDASPVPDDPEATVRKMQIVARAALAPADPSPQDYRVAAQARQQEMAAKAEAARKQMEDTAPYGVDGRPDVARPPALFMSFSA